MDIVISQIHSCISLQNRYTQASHTQQFDPIHSSFTHPHTHVHNYNNSYHFTFNLLTIISISINSSFTHM